MILERGGFVPREKANWDPKLVNLEGKYHTKETWHDRDGHALHPHTNYYVGGNTKFYGAALFRFREIDFLAMHHHDGISPAWPISYNDLEPYYSQAEQLYHVHGQHGEDPTSPPASTPYPFPPVSHEPRIQELADDLTAIGLRPFHTPLGVMLSEKDRRASPCIRCDTCDGFPCLINAKADAQTCGIDPALSYPNVTLLTDAMVERLETTASGRGVSKVVVKRNQQHEEYSANIFVLSCGAINSAALLLRSANQQHPHGLANRSDVVGRHYMGHVNSVQLALSKTPNPTVFQKTLSINDYYFGDHDFPYPMGHISFVGKLDAQTLRAGAPALAPGWTLELMAHHSLDFWLTTEDLPAPENRVTLDAKGGIVLSYRPNNEVSHKRLINKLHELIKCSTSLHHDLFARSLWVGQRIPLAGVAHQVGTVRFGDNPATSALDVHCKAHDVDNLNVVDGSFFVSSGAVNPALTIMANALRVGDHLLERVR